MGNKRKPTQGPAARSKQRKITKGPKGRGQPARQQNVPLPPPSDDEQEDYEVEDEDVEFVQQHAARLGFLTDLDTVQLNRSVEDKQKATAAAAAAAGSDHKIHSEEELNSDEDAEEYERKPRAAEQVQKASSRGLPVKTPTGEVVYQPSKKQQQQLQAAKVQVEGVSVQDSLQLEQQMQKAAAKEEAAAAEAERQAAAKQQQLLKQQQKALAAKSAASGEDAGALPPALLSLMSIQDQQQRRDALKQQMALAAQHLLAEPDKHVKQGLRLLLGCAADRDGQVARLALLSMLAVFKDILPGYRIRSLTEDEQEMRVSKEVAALREFEQSLLKSYQAYLKTLLAAATAKPAAGGSSSSVLATARIAVRCLGQLLVTKPGFNYSSDLLQALVPLMVHSDVQIREEACSCMQQLLREDIQGKTSLEAVQLVADLVKKKKCNMPPLVVSSLLVLRFEQVTPISQGGEGAGGKGPKKGSKSRKKRKKSDVDRDFEEADAAPDAAELAILQSQMLEALFEIFFRVLKHCSAATANHTAAAATGTDPASAGSPAAAAAAANGIHSQSEAGHSGSSSTAPLVQPWPAARVHKKFPLLQPCLEGLGRYSHLISVEYFNDLMTVLQQLLSAGALPVRERLGLLLSALDILKGQGEALTIDRRAFYNHLYQMLLLVPLHVLFEAPESSSSAAAGHVGANGTGSTAAAAVDDPAAELDDVEDEQALQAVTVSLLGWEAAGAAGDGSSSNSSREVVPTSVLLLRCLEQQLLGVKQTDMGRLAAFTKRLAELMLSSSTAEAVGAACLMWRLIKRYNKLVCQFEWEGGAPVGGRQYDPDCFDPSEAGGMAAALWELTLLTHHYHPHVAAAAKALLALTPSSSKAAAAGGRDDGTGSSGGTSNSAITGAAGPYELAGEYEATKRGGFRPPPAAPAGFKATRGAAAGSSRASMSARQAAAAAAWCQDLQQAASALKAGHQIVADETRQQQQQQQQLGKNRKQKQQKQQQVHQQQCLSMQELAALADDVDWQEFESAVQQHYHLSKQYDQNQRLQRELALTARKVELFREHLIQKRQQQQQQQQQRKGAKKGRQQ